MKNSGFYDENGKLIDVKESGITIEQLCDYKTGIELYNPNCKNSSLIYLLLLNFSLRRKYLIAYNNQTDSLNERLVINDFVKNFKEIKEKNKAFIDFNKQLDMLKQYAEKQKELEFKKVRELYSSMNEAYEKMLKYHLDPEVINGYVDSLQGLVYIYHQIYDYDLNLDPEYKSILNNINKLK